MLLLRGKHLSKRIGKQHVFRRMSLEAGRGRLTLLTGPNGSGKSVMLMVLAGVLAPTAGILEYGETGRPRTSWSPAEQGLDEFLTVRENVACWGGGAERTARQLRLWGLDNLSSVAVEKLSHGQRKRVLLARAFSMPRVDLHLLDEPVEGLDGRFRGTLLEQLGKVLEEGAGAVVATHEPDAYAPLSPARVEMGLWD